ncbi:MAG: cytochrome c biogenesis protein CcdA [Chloroflexota bacterium]|nr:cytochrome c biogenesis protein CcdA [Chloroflexota bacterium]
MSPVELGLAFVAGLVSFASPCCLPMVPMYLSYLAGIAGRGTVVTALAPPAGTGTGTAIAMRAQPSRALIMLHAAAFVAGFSVIFVALGASASVLGVLLRTHLLLLRHVAGVLIVLFGLHTAGLLRVSWLYRERRAHVDPTTGVGLGRSAALGLAFAAGWSPCIGPMLGSILLLAGNTATLGQGVLLLIAYSVGLGLPFLLAATFVQGLAERLRRVNRYFGAINLVAGALLVVMGVMVYAGVFLRLATLFQPPV